MFVESEALFVVVLPRRGCAMHRMTPVCVGNSSCTRRPDLDVGPGPELELIQPRMVQKPVLRGEVGCTCVAREVSVERGGMGERGCARRLGGWVWV